jgi:hypothetical protein
MSQSRSERFSIRHALGLSTGLHVLIAPLFIVSSVALTGGGQSAESLGFRGGATAAVMTMTIEHRQRRHAAPRAALHPPLTAKKVASKDARPLARHAAAAVDTPAQGSAGATVRRGRVSATEGSAVLSIVRDSVVTQPAEAATSAPKTEATPASAPTSAPGPAGQATAAAVVLASAQSTTGRVYESPNGGWGQYFERPLIADETSLSELRSKYHFSAAITVSVDENGRATKVSFPNAVPSDVRADLEKRLTSLRYIPAECNGLRCSASLSIVI